MSQPEDPGKAPPPAVDNAPTPAVLAQIKQELAHLFRHSLRQGHINPLMHVIMAYRGHELP